jgi:hypothetical protein
MPPDYSYFHECHLSAAANEDSFLAKPKGAPCGAPSIQINRRG